MTDYFALLDEPRRPWLAADQLKSKFLARSAEVHPDRTPAAEREAASRRYAELNAAYNCLRDPKERLRHLFELENGVKPKELQEIPANLAELFMEIGRVCRETDQFLAEQARTNSPLLRANLFDRAQHWAERLLALQKTVGERRDSVLQRLQLLNNAWQETGTRAGALAELEVMYRLLGFFGRWTSQLQERLVRLAL